MIPIGPLIWIAIRLATPNNRSSTPSGQIKVPAYVGVSLLVFVLVALYAMFTGAGAPPGFPVPFPPVLLLAPALVLVSPWAIVRFVFVPMGWSWLAFVYARLACFTFRHAPNTGAPFAAALALSKAGRHSEKMEARIVQRVARIQVEKSSLLGRPTFVDAKLDGAGVAALGFIAVSRSDRDAARSLFRFVLDFPRARTPAVVLEECMQWLAADAFDRGDGDFLEELARNNPGVFARIFRFLFVWGEKRRAERPWTRVALPPAARLLARLARYQRHGPGELGSLPIWLLLARTGRPLLFPVVRHGLANRGSVRREAVARGDALVAAVSRHAAALSAPASLHSADRLKDLCARWEQALRDREIAPRLLARELELGIASEQTMVDRLRTTAVADIARVCLETGAAPSNGPGDFLRQVAGHVRSDALRSLEAAVAARAARIQQRGAVDCESELRDYLAIRDAYQRVARLGPEPRRLALSIVMSSVWDHAAKLFNDHGQRPFAHAQFRWLLREAEATGHGAAVAPLRKNVELSRK